MADLKNLLLKNCCKCLEGYRVNQLAADPQGGEHHLTGRPLSLSPPEAQGEAAAAEKLVYVILRQVSQAPVIKVVFSIAQRKTCDSFTTL